jgi:hypothetical protein
VLRHDHRRAGRPREVDRSRGAVGVELGSRLVEQQQPRLEDEHRGQADALELAARELGHAPIRQVARTDRLERRPGSPCDLRRRGSDVLEPEGNLRLDPREDDLILWILEERCHRPGKLRRPGPPRVVSCDLDLARELAAVEVRHQAGQRAEQRRLARAGWAHQGDDLALPDLQRHVTDRRLRSGVGEREPANAR